MSQVVAPLELCDYPPRHRSQSDDHPPISALVRPSHRNVVSLFGQTIVLQESDQGESRSVSVRL